MAVPFPTRLHFLPLYRYSNANVKPDFQPYARNSRNTTFQASESVSRFLTVHQHILGYLVPYHGLVDFHKREGRAYNLGYLATIKYKLEIRLKMGMYEIKNDCKIHKINNYVSIDMVKQVFK